MNGRAKPARDSTIALYRWGVYDVAVDIRQTGAVSRLLGRSALVAVLAALLLGVAGVHCGLPRWDFHPAQLSPSLPAAPADQLMINGEHALRSDAPTPLCPGKLATAALPQSVTAAAVAVLAVVGLGGLQADPVVFGGRSPPAGPGCVISGRVLLTRLCLARR
ncbi:Lipoprotein LpqS [Mycobacterium attenuatum]|nr:Lipoprotein LpqS [Mycobacterium attenuatum]VBA47768.1 Lipoprotein LpqS [Mycobacterium attenuatum]